MAENLHDTLSRRERQIMDIIYRLGEATVNEVLEGLEEPPSYSAVRAHLRILEEKGWKPSKICTNTTSLKRLIRKKK